MFKLILLLAVLGTLWFLDEFLTLKDLKLKGVVEENVITKWFIKKGKYDFLVFKGITFTTFCVLAWLAWQLHAYFFYALVGAVIVIYFIVDFHNLEILEKEKV